VAVISRLTRAASLLVIALAVTTMSACAPEPQPSPAPTPAFASEEEAFAAAEEVYRAYIDAVNAENRGEPDASPQDFLTGTILDADVASRRELEASGVRIEGSTEILNFHGTAADIETVVPQLVAAVCLDISKSRAIDASGQDVTAVGRSDVYGISVTFIGDEHSLLISEYEIMKNAEC
jgi:hypothetical protein